MEDCNKFISQRRMWLTYSTPPVRYDNLASSPYPDFTSEQLNMRRKVEILKYNKNRLSKKEREALISRGNYRGNTIFCSNDNIVVPSSAAGVPGPSIDLFEDKNVPLYMYASNTSTNAIVASENIEEWTNIVLPNINIPSGLNNITNYASLIIQKAIKKNSYVYTYIAPITFKLQGTNIPIIANGNKISIILNNIKTKIFYSSSEIAVNNSSTVLDSTEMEIALNTTGSTAFSYIAEIYIGYITVSNIGMQTVPGQSFNFGLTYNASIKTDNLTDSTTIINNTTFSICMNIDDTYNINSANNCTIISPSVSNKNKGISFTGV